jgi:hypothetical protein
MEDDTEDGRTKNRANSLFWKSSDGGSKVFDGKGGLIYVLNVWFYLDFDYHDRSDIDLNINGNTPLSWLASGIPGSSWTS